MSMKKNIILSIIIFLIIMFGCVSSSYKIQNNYLYKKHIGHWVGIDSSGRNGELYLFPNGFAAFLALGTGFGGAGFTKVGALVYEIDYKVSPNSLDLIWISNEYKEQKRVKFIIDFFSENKMQICSFMNNTRPKSFDKSVNCFKIKLNKIN